MNDTKELRFAELVINPCSRTYGTSPCSASVGVTGDFKCYNSPRTCQDPANYSAGGDQIIRWAAPTSDLPIEVEAMPCITSITRRPQVVDAGEGLGVRESAKVTMHNFKHNDAGFDNYLSDRGYNTYDKGTYWGKFAARWGSLEGYEFRTIDGYEGQSLSEMTYRHYVVDSTSGPDAAGNFSFTVKDAIKMLDGDKAQWPRPSTGKLLAAITDVDTTLTLTPTGIGDSEYPASGTASIGDEKVTFTRLGDTITLTARGLSGSETSEHDEGETFQIAAVFVDQSPAEIIRDLLTDATDINTDYLDYAVWQDEMDNYLNRTYSAEVMQPTHVNSLISELCREAGLTIFTNLNTKKITVKVLRQEVPTTFINDDSMLAGSISSKKLAEKRVSDVWVYYGKRNPLEKQSEQKNYRAIFAQLSGDAIAALESNPRAIREITSRWITIFNATAAVSVSDRMISRYETIPRQVSFRVPNSYPLKLGSQFTLQSRIFEDAQGDQEEPLNCQVVRLENAGGVYTALADEVVFNPVDPSSPELRVITIDSDTTNLNLRSAHDAIYTSALPGQTIQLVIADGVTISSMGTGPAIDIGFWAGGIEIEISGSSLAKIRGHGGLAGTVNNGGDGGDAIYTEVPITITGDMVIWGGGGGGGAGINELDETIYFGGGGAGVIAGAGGVKSPFATDTLGGAGFSVGQQYGGDGGDVGENGEAGEGLDSDDNALFTTGGTAGASINGSSFTLITGSPDLKGPQVN